MPTTEPTDAQLRMFRDADQHVPITMVNLLKFRDRAEYQDVDAAGGVQISGREEKRLLLQCAINQSPDHRSRS